IAAHWKYKQGGGADAAEDERIKWLRRMVEWHQESPDDPMDFVETLKGELRPNAIHIMTPRGKIISLPAGATPIDFAYAIHTEVGNQCTGAKVDGRIVRLNYELKNGQRVEIMTTPGHKPSRDWLNFTRTSRARNKIKHYVAEQQRIQSIDIGRKLFEKEALRHQLKIKSIVDDERMRQALADYGFGKIDDLYAALGYGKIKPRAILLRFLPEDKLAEAEQKRSPLQKVSAAVRSALRLGEDRVTVHGIDDVMVNRAHCCNPIRGEQVIGYITLGKGVAVHARRCKNVANLMVNRERIIEVSWAGEGGKTYAVTLSVITENRMGMLASLTNAVAGIKTNIFNASADVLDDGSGRIMLTVEINDVKHLDRVIAALKAVDGVIDVERANEKPGENNGR
ncbi:MAG: TGS domain-containing protein, partial [Blastocatellia bacterium]